MSSSDEWSHLHVLFTMAMSVFEYVDSTEAQIADSIAQVLPELRKPSAAVAKGAFDYWYGAFEAVRAATTRAEIKNIVRTYVCTSNPHTHSPFNIVQGIMKATIHTMWRKLYELEAGQLKADPREAVRDALLPPASRGQELLRMMVKEIATETGETADQLMARVTGDDNGV
jgi:hypothetical protein